MKKFIFWSWILLSLTISTFVCLSSKPIRDEYFPSLLDYINSAFFLAGGAVMISSLSCIIFICFKNKRIKVALISVLVIIMAFYFVHVFQSMFSLYILIVEASFILFTVSSVHFFLTYFIGKTTLKISLIKE
ncbi:hypothetical protein CGZ90_13525 [Fictibacillus aquaticus]|uniref:Uncharacterized protein n=1 Tax=Fictibacillus aquaticus TaxID=2021314 RepID=A0A235F929_9BACL|nr:hypothetical protein CGZ90_13525 [Fictibacillus aquaticus]